MIVCTHSIVSWSDLPSILSRPMQSNPPATYAGAGESFSKPYSNDLNSELDYCTTGMFNKDTLNVPTGINHVGLFTNSRAKFNEGAFLFQILIPMDNPFLYVRVHWNKTWYNWKRVALADVAE